MLLQKHFLDIDSRKIYCFVQVIFGIIQLRTVNLSELCLVVQRSSDKDSSNYRRLQRFFEKPFLNISIIAKLMMSLFASERVTIFIDRTNWMFGKASINIFFLSIAYKGIGVPILWHFIPHKGSTDLFQRKRLLLEFIDLFGVNCIEALLGDREFSGDKWYKWLDSQKVPFIFRNKESVQIGRAKGELTTATHLVKALKNGESIDLEGKRRISQKTGAIKLYVSACRNKEGELVIVLSNIKFQNALNIYKKRWEIETLFSCLKIRGFNLERTHMKCHQKISTLIAILSFAFAWAYKIGEWKSEKEPIKLKNHQRKEVSIFKYGLDEIRKIILNQSYNAVHKITELIKIAFEKLIGENYVVY